MSATFSKLPKPIFQRIALDTLSAFGVSLHVKRDDLIDDVVSGNKLFKLHHHLQAFHAQNKQTLITFGGAFSNHLHATAYIGQALGIKTVGIIRAEPHELKNLTPTLSDCQSWGMTLAPVSRSEYKLKQDSGVVQKIANQYPDIYWVPEGGAGELGVQGAQLILDGVDQSHYDVIVLACGTGTTLAGVIRASEPHVQVIGVPVLKGAKWMAAEVEQYLDAAMNNWQLVLDYHFSGYGKWNDELLNFMADIQAQTGLPLDPVYTAKAFYGLVDLIRLKTINKGSRVLFIHTGGLQGARL
jgi:1-aminocyclopropane-1-carboxylate deaminase